MCVSQSLLHATSGSTLNRATELYSLALADKTWRSASVSSDEPVDRCAPSMLCSVGMLRTSQGAQGTEHGSVRWRKHCSNIQCVVEVRHCVVLRRLETEQVVVRVGVGSECVPQRLVASLQVTSGDVHPMGAPHTSGGCPCVLPSSTRHTTTRCKQHVLGR